MGRRLAAAVLTGLGLTVGALAPASAAAPVVAPASVVAPAGKASVRTGVETTAQERAVTGYWSPARMASAVPGEVLAPPAAVPVPSAAAAGSAAPTGAAPAAASDGTPVTVRGTAPSGATAAAARVQQPAATEGSAWTRGGRVARTTGRAFFTLAGTDYVCTASAVTSANRSTVLTAGHCVVGRGTFATRFTFVPGYSAGRAPYGQWTARVLATTPQYRRSEDPTYDVGFAVLNTRGGRRLADVVGAQGIAFNQPRGQATTAFGYPAAAPYTGETLLYCAGSARRDTVGASPDQALACRMNGGSSGGPWFAAFDVATGTGTTTSVNSFQYSLDPRTLYGPYFGAQVRSTWALVQRA